MSQENNLTSSAIEEKSFAELLDESLHEQPNEVDISQLVKGTVIRVEEEYVFIDLGYKSEGIIPIIEFLNKDEQPEVEIGCEVEVLVEKTGSSLPKVSKQKADFFREKEFIKKKFETAALIDAKVLSRVKGGLSCDIGNITSFKAFLPGSQIDVRPVSNFDEFVGKTLSVKIIQHDDKGIVVSRRSYLEEERKVLKQKTLSQIEENKVISGKVVKIIDRGAFVDIGGLEGFIPLSEVSWGRIRNAGEVIKEGSEIEVKVLKIENERVTLGYKQTQPDPWSDISEKYTIGSNVKGKAVSTTDFGIFVELESGIEGLVHISELSWTKNFRHPKELVATGTMLEVKVLEINSKEKRISLSLKQIEKSPWETFKQSHKPGAKVKGIIKNINEIGIFVEVGEELVGLVRPENISWKDIVNPLDVYNTSQIGEEIDVVVLNVTPNSGRIALGIKQITTDPWANALKNYKTNQTVVTAKIEEIKENGILVNLDNEIKGYYQSRDLVNEGSSETLKSFNIGDEITGIVTGFDKNKRQINLSRKKHEQKQEKARLKNFVSSQGDSSFKLGNLLSEKLKTLD
ncbi:MAG: S1 RNA-binding domain-containing protein [Thermodesulfobacteriota bacterium]